MIHDSELALIADKYRRHKANRFLIFEAFRGFEIPLRILIFH